MTISDHINKNTVTHAEKMLEIIFKNNKQEVSVFWLLSNIFVDRTNCAVYTKTIDIEQREYYSYFKVLSVYLVIH